MRNEIINKCKSWGADLVGFAPIDRFPADSAVRKLLPEAKTVIGLGFRVLRGVYRGIEEGSTYYQYTTMGVENMEETVMPIVQVSLAMFLEESGYLGMNELIESGNVPRAILCAYDNIAVGVMRSLFEHNMRVPEDVAIIGMDDISYCKYLTPSLSSISFESESVCKFTCEKIINLILGNHCENFKKFNATLKLRESSEI